MANIEEILRVTFEEVEETVPTAPTAARFRSLATSGTRQSAEPEPVLSASNILEVDFWPALNTRLSRLKSKQAQLESSEAQPEVLVAASGTTTLPAMVIQTLPGGGKAFGDTSLVVNGPPVLTVDGKLCLFVGLVGDLPVMDNGGSVPGKVMLQLLMAGEVVDSRRLESPDVEKLLLELPTSIRSKLPALSNEIASEKGGLRLPISAFQFRLLIE